MPLRKYFFLTLLLLICLGAAGQDTLQIERDTLYIEGQDTLLLKSYAKRYNPRKALLYAAVIPGLGQIYNKKYWKLPLVYGGFYLLYNGIDHYNSIYRTYKVHLFENLDDPLTAGPTGRNPTTNLTTNQLRRIVDRTRRDRDFMVILIGGMYILQMIDAHVDAHLKEFDLNPNLKARIEPMLHQDVLLGRQTGVALILRF
jgi:hypothetical protein